MDETPEELAEIEREALAIDPHKYRRRYRMTVGILAFLSCAVVVWVAIHMATAARNPCERLRNYFCGKAPEPAKCASYLDVHKESVSDSSPKMRSVIRDQCLTKITRMKEEDGITVE